MVRRVSLMGVEECVIWESLAVKPEVTTVGEKEFLMGEDISE